MRAVRDQEGSALIAAVMLMVMMMGVALAAYALVDTEQTMSATERRREVAFNLSEQVLNAQVYKLSRHWPAAGRLDNPYPDCGAGVVDSRCPDGAAIVQRFGGPDLAAGATWTTAVRDNNSPNLNYYDDAVTLAQPHYDANGDDRVWVRAQAAVPGTRRTIVALVRVNRQVEEMPRGVLLAGRFGTTNSGLKVIVETAGAALNVRCLTRTPECLDYSAQKGQVSPDSTRPGYTGGNAMSDEQIARLRERAIAEGTYHESCPASPSGALVFVESGDCFYNNSASPCCNTVADPGVLIINRGTLSLDGNIVFHGMVYMPNRNGSSGWVISLNGTAMIRGAAVVDGPGGLLAGSSGLNLSYDPNVFNRVLSYPSAGVVQNTWREIAAG